MSYVPPQELLERYATLLVDFALGSGAGIAPGEVVSVTASEAAKPLYVEVCRAVWRSGGHVIHGYQPSDEPGMSVRRDFLELASDAQLDFFAEHYWRGYTEQVDHRVYLHADSDPHVLSGVDPSRIMRAGRARLPLRDWLDAKEDAGEMTWNIALYGTEAMAAEARMSIEEYWEQIIAACFLDDPDPTARWREVERQIAAHCAWLNGLEIERLHVEGEDADLWITIGEHRRWLGGGGRNIPSFEIFTSPDHRGTEGWIRFTEPLYIYGSLITGIELRFEGGRVVQATATENEALLKEMIATEGADAVGEFSLTDARLSRITRFMADTLYDENVGGPYGNTHVAVGFAIRAAYDGDPAGLGDDEWAALGFNHSSVHTDIVQTSDRTVTAILRDGSERLIYAAGRFQHDA